MTNVTNKQMSEYIVVKVKVPEDYKDVCAELIYEDFCRCPEAWETELCSTAAQIRQLAGGKE